MGGQGSGDWYRFHTKATVEQCLTLDVDALEIYWFPGEPHSHTVTWTNNRTHEEAGSIGYRVEPIDVRWTGSEPPEGRGFRAKVLTCSVWLNYQKKGSEVLDYPVRVESTRLYSGGIRRWFRCPILTDGRTPCWRRVKHLHLPSGARYFGCRQCHGLTYRSSQEAHQTERLFGSLSLEMGMDREAGIRLAAQMFGNRKK